MGVTSSTGILKQKQKLTCPLGLGRVIIAGLLLGAGGLVWPAGFGFFFCAASTSPSRSASVSKLVRSSRIGVFDFLGPGLDLADMLACSLCCQQYRDSSRGSSARSRPRLMRRVGPAVEPAASGRRHGRPLEVMPRHVVAGFFESDRSISDSGVFAMKGMVAKRGGVESRKATVRHGGIYMNDSQ
jgi:hypothetical protein